MKQLTLKIGVSGVRGIAGVSLTPQIVASFAAAFGTFCGRGLVVVGTDTRPSRAMVTPAVVSGLMSVGCTPVTIGIVPVPTLQHHVRQTQAVGGICVTASHNPMEWNALKFCGADGITLRSTQFDELLDLYHQGVYSRVSSKDIPAAIKETKAPQSHFKSVLSALDVEVIRQRRFRVVVDCCNGAGSIMTPRFLRSLGCEVHEIHTRICDPFPRNPEPIRRHLSDLCAEVQRTNSDIGFAQDADADRLALVDNRGQSLGEDCTLALAVDHYLERAGGPVVVSASTSRMVEEVALARNTEVYRTRVGEVNVVQRMLEVDSPIGGEGNGGVILSSVNPCRDSFVGMGLVLESLARTSLPLRDLRAALPQYHIIKEKVPCNLREAARLLRLVKHLYRDQHLDLTDGVKVDFPDKWLQVRSSSTEPILRVIAEARTVREAQELIDSVMEYLRPVEEYE